MRNTILIDPTMNAVNALSSSLGKLQRAQAGTLSFREIQAQIDARYDSEAQAAKDWSLAEYKTYFREQVAALPVDESRAQDTITIDLTDAAFERMQADPAYEQWVLGKISAKLASKNTLATYGNRGVSLLHFGAAEADYREDSWGRDDFEWMDFLSYNPLYSSNAARKRQTSFWTKRVQAMNRQMLSQAMLARQTQQLNQMTDQLAAMRQLAALNGQSTASPSASAAGLTGDYRRMGAQLTGAYLAQLLQQSALLAGQ